MSTELLNRHRSVVSVFEALARKVQKGLGWHYLLDLPWAANEILREGSRPSLVLDAGAGTGLMQWHLAEQGIDVISVDRLSRYHLPDHFRCLYQVAPWRDGHLGPQPRSVRRALRRLFGRRRRKPAGTVYIYNHDLSQLVDIQDSSVDCVVSISSLEHNSPDDLRIIVQELLRVLKPGGKLVATLGAAQDKDWLHGPSQGWNYTERTMRDIFQLAPECPSN